MNKTVSKNFIVDVINNLEGIKSNNLLDINDSLGIQASVKALTKDIQEIIEESKGIEELRAEITKEVSKEKELSVKEFEEKLTESFLTGGYTERYHQYQTMLKGDVELELLDSEVFTIKDLVNKYYKVTRLNQSTVAEILSW